MPLPPKKESEILLHQKMSLACAGLVQLWQRSKCTIFGSLVLEKQQVWNGAETCRRVDSDHLRYGLRKAKSLGRQAHLVMPAVKGRAVGAGRGEMGWE